MQPIVPTIYRTGKPDIDRNLDEIAKAMRRLSDAIGKEITKVEGEIPPAVTLDHKFSTDATDESASGAGYALAKFSSNGNVKPSLDTSSSQRRTRWDYTAPDLIAPAVDAMHMGYSSCGVSFLFGSAWTESPAGTWTRNVTGEYPSAFCDDVSPFQGMTVLAWQTPGLSPSELKYAGLYTLTTLGGVGTHAVLTRTSTTLVHGLLAYIKGGTIHAGQTWKLDTADPIVPDTTDQEWVMASAGGSTGAVDHRGTTYRDAADQHPMASITPGRVHTPCIGCTETGGLLSIPATQNGGAIVFAGGEFHGIDATGFSTGDHTFVIVNGATNLAPVAVLSDSGSVAAANRLYLGTAGQGVAQNFLITMDPCYLEFRYFGEWHLVNAREVVR